MWTGLQPAPLPVWHDQHNWAQENTSISNDNVIKTLDQVGMLFLSDLSRQECRTYTTTSQQEFDVRDSPTGHGQETCFRRQQTHDGDRSPDVSDTRSHCFQSTWEKLNTCSHLTECAEKPRDTSRTSPSARRTGSNENLTEQARFLAAVMFDAPQFAVLSLASGFGARGKAVSAASGV